MTLYHLNPHLPVEPLPLCPPLHWLLRRPGFFLPDNSLAPCASERAGRNDPNASGTVASPFLNCCAGGSLSPGDREVGAAEHGCELATRGGSRRRRSDRVPGVAALVHGGSRECSGRDAHSQPGPKRAPQVPAHQVPNSLLSEGAPSDPNPTNSWVRRGRGRLPRSGP